MANGENSLSGIIGKNNNIIFPTKPLLQRGNKKMKKKMCLMLSLALLMALPTIAFAQAIPIQETNNDKFEPYLDQGMYNAVAYSASAERTYVPSFESEQINKLVVNVDEVFFDYAITVGDHTYRLGKDFTYTGHATVTYFDPVFKNTVTKTGIASCRFAAVMVTYTFDFSAYAGSIDGALTLQAVFAQGIDKVHTISGTEDLKGVQITAGNVQTISNPPTINVEHAGTVMGWPDIAPL